MDYLNSRNNKRINDTETRRKALLLDFLSSCGAQQLKSPEDIKTTYTLDEIALLGDYITAWFDGYKVKD